MTRKPKRQIRIFTEEEIQSISSYIKNHSEGNPKKVSFLCRFCKIRDSSMVLFGYYCGLRPSEILKAKLENLSLEQKSYFIESFTNKQRQSDEVPIPSKIIPLLRQYLILRQKYCPNSIYLFPAQPKSNMNKTGYLARHTFAINFKKAVKALGFYKVCYKDSHGQERGNISLYCLRHSFGSWAYSKLKDVMAVSTLMRHRNVESSYRYIHYSLEQKRKELIEDVFG